jgi:hypothetical protein
MLVAKVIYDPGRDFDVPSLKRSAFLKSHARKGGRPFACNDVSPVVTIKYNLFGVQFAVKASLYLRFGVTVEAKHCQIFDRVVGIIFVEVVNLYGLSLRAANAARSVRIEKDICSSFGRDGHIYLFRYLSSPGPLTNNEN